MERRLGRGLGSLLSEPEPTTDPAELKIQAIRPNPFQPRKTFDPGALEELRDSIQNHGVLQPIVVRAAEGGYELVSGERRWRAARLAGLESIPAVLRANVDDHQMLELALVENVQRQDLDPIEKARGYRALMDGLGLNQEGIAAKVGLRRSSVANHLRLLELPDEVQKAVASRLLTMGHARAILGLPKKADQLQLMEETVRHGLSVREVERRVREGVQRKTRPSAGSAPSGESTPPWAREMEARMRQHLGTKVTLTNGPDYRGQIVIDYFNRDDLERIYAILAPPVPSL